MTRNIDLHKESGPSGRRIQPNRPKTWKKRPVGLDHHTCIVNLDIIAIKWKCVKAKSGGVTPYGAIRDILKTMAPTLLWLSSEMVRFHMKKLENGKNTLQCRHHHHQLAGKICHLLIRPYLRWHSMALAQMLALFCGQRKLSFVPMVGRKELLLKMILQQWKTPTSIFLADVQKAAQPLDSTCEVRGCQSLQKGTWQKRMDPYTALMNILCGSQEANWAPSSTIQRPSMRSTLTSISVSPPFAANTSARNWITLPHKALHFWWQHWSPISWKSLSGLRECAVPTLSAQACTFRIPWSREWPLQKILRSGSWSITS